MNNKQIARLYCMLSDDKKKVAIIRKGPAKWTQLILWDLENDNIQEGQWLHGSVYQDKCDISPNGKYVSIAIAKYALKHREVEEFYSWTCISKPPFFTSLLTLLEKTRQTSGGYFIDDNHFVYNGERDEIVRKGINPDNSMKVSYKYDSARISLPGENPLNEKRLNKNGWITTQEGKGTYHKSELPLIRVKEVNSQLSLVMESEVNHFKESTKYFTKQNDILNLIDDAQWMDFDYKQRILLAKDGKIFVSTKANIGLEAIDFKELMDFNESKPKEVKPTKECLLWE